MSKLTNFSMNPLGIGGSGVNRVGLDGRINSGVNAANGTNLYTGGRTSQGASIGATYNTMHSPLSRQNIEFRQAQQAFNNYDNQFRARQGMNNYFAQQAAERRMNDDLKARRQADTRWGWEKEKFGWAREDRGFLKEDRATSAADRARNMGFEDSDRAWQEEQRAWQRQMWERARNAFSTGTGGGGGGSVAVGGSYGVNQS